ncbi:MAG: glutathione peroxidase [Solirubrobacteraceae bacterium]
MGKLRTLRTIGMYLQRSPKLIEKTDLYAHTVSLLNGEQLDLSSFRGHPTLIVNTASKCGFTPQYAGLQALYERYHERGLELLGSPSGDFADQEFQDAAAIGAFCEENYEVRFPLTARTSVRASPGPFWAALISQPDSEPPSWNFCKYLVGADGYLVAHWGSRVVPEDPQITAKIEAVLPAGTE